MNDPHDPTVWWEYIGEELAIFWNSPFGGDKEKIASFWWPCHPPESTGEVERFFEILAARITQGKGEDIKA